MNINSVGNGLIFILSLEKLFSTDLISEDSMLICLFYIPNCIKVSNIKVQIIKKNNQKIDKLKP